MNVEQGEESRTCSIFTAAANGNIERMRVLLNQGASVNSTDETEETPLRLALENVRGDCVKFLPNNDVNDDNRVPTRTGKPGKPGKMGRHFPVREKSGNFEQTGKVREKSGKIIQNTGKLR